MNLFLADLMVFTVRLLGLDMRKSGLLRPLFGAIALALALMVVFVPAVLAQGGPALFEVFTGPDPDSEDLEPRAVEQLADAMRKAQAPGQCPLGRLTIIVPKGDDLFQKALAIVRRDALLQALARQGVNVAGRLFVSLDTSGGRGTGTKVKYEVARDLKPPKLTTTSQPAKGTKVKPGGLIKVTMVARDDPDPWPTGVKTVQLVAESEGGRFIASQNYEPCAEPAERRVEATYRVPCNPPPVVRLAALAEDHVGLMDTDVAEFPVEQDGQPSAFPPREGCSDKRQTITWFQGIEGRCTGSLSICGDKIQAACPTRGAWVSAGSKKGPVVCCDDWRKARKTNQPCDVGQDADCDGIKNSEDGEPLRPCNSPPSAR